MLNSDSSNCNFSTPLQSTGFRVFITTPKISNNRHTVTDMATVFSFCSLNYEKKKQKANRQQKKTTCCTFSK